ncbi:class I SAM-dependent methyltransferase [Aestuariimicrobium ganziense]|uniref:class I SAM-dependent methyltransferase n=1 Tax=Aestuariimicrobium ganziense TaxID=2773677 RepID=UPI001940A77C|nr:class I SAM-dependent methyltransferase [Aestuariimicrobium ganziense]
MSYDHPSLAAIYDHDNPDGPDHDWFRRFVDDAAPAVVTDLGCGTGLLTVTLARPGRRVVGIDPAPSMLALAAARPGGDQVEWRLGTSDQIEQASSDVVIMSGNVAMHLIGDEWHHALRRIAAGLRPGGRLAFETRNPSAEAWREWNDPLTDRDTPAGRLRESSTTTAPDADGVVTMHCHNEFLDDGEVVDFDLRLQFRDLDRITADLAAAGVMVSRVSRDWHSTPFTGTAAERLMVVEASTGR